MRSKTFVTICDFLQKQFQSGSKSDLFFVVFVKKSPNFNTSNSCNFYGPKKEFHIPGLCRRRTVKTGARHQD